MSESHLFSFFSQLKIGQVAYSILATWHIAKTSYISYTACVVVLQWGYFRTGQSPGIAPIVLRSEFEHVWRGRSGFLWLFVLEAHF